MTRFAIDDCRLPTAWRGRRTPGRVRKCLLALLALAVGAAFAGQPQDPPQQQQTPQQPDATRSLSAPAATRAAAGSRLRPGVPDVRGVLFRVTAPKAAVRGRRAGSDAPRAGVGYLFGTIHFGTPEEQGIDYGKLGKLIEGVTVFANEADADARWDPAFNALMYLSPQTPLSSLIDAEGMAQARQLLPEVKEADLQRMKPWTVLTLLEARGEGTTYASLDTRMQKMARAAGKRLVHLESVEDQLRALDCVPTREQAQVLAERLRRPWFLQADSAEAMAAYRGRDLGAWLANVDRMDGLDDAAKAIEQRSRLCLLENRNTRWIEQIEALYRGEPTLIAVGALHLAGPNGLIARLRKDGFTVEEVPF